MSDKSLLSEPEKRRFAKQMALPGIGTIGQEKLKKAKIAIIGIGGLGSSVLQYLAATGVGNIGIIDFAMVEENNIQKQTLYGGSDLGKLKSIIGKQNVHEMFPFVNYEIINLQLTSVNVSRIINPFELIVDATNRVESNVLIGEACASLDIPLVYGNVVNYEGSVAVIEKGFFREYHNFLYSKQQTVEDNLSKGALALAYGLVGNLMAFETFKYLIGHETLYKGEILHMDLLNFKTERNRM